MKKEIRIVLLFVVVGLFLFSSWGNVFSEDSEPEYQYDSLDRLVKVIYSDGDEVRYEYYDDSDIIFKVSYYYMGTLDYISAYDPEGNLIAEDDVYYNYNQESNLREIKDENSKVSFSYYPNGDLLSESVFIDGKKFTTIYKWNGDGLLSEIITLVDKTTYEYDENFNLIRETLLTKVNGNEFQTQEDVSYEHDEEGYLTAMVDGYTGERIEYGYEVINYECEEAFCQTPCGGQEECFPIYNCDESGESCQEISCFEVGFRLEDCSYKVLKNKTINDYTVWYENPEADYEDVVYNANTWDANYDPEVSFNEEGYLTSEEGINYSWKGDLDYGYYLDKISIPGFFEEDVSVGFGYDEDYFLKGNSFSSGMGDASVEYSYDVLGRLVYEEPSSESFPQGFTGSVIKLMGNVVKLTGKAVDSTNSDNKIYYVGSNGNVISSDEYYKLISPENIWPELQEYYSGACIGVEEDGTCIVDSVFEEFSCIDIDAGENDTLTYSYVDFVDGFFYDYCKDNKTLIENYCGTDLLRWDFWNIEQLVAKEKEITCPFGCSFGRCLENGSPSECLLDSDCLTGEICVGGICEAELDLPGEPDAPSGRI